MTRDHVIAIIAGILRANGGDVLHCVVEAEEIVGLAEERGEREREAARVRAARAAVPVANGFKEWPSIAFPPWLRTLGFEDGSRLSDPCGRAEFPLGPRVGKYPKLLCWVEHPLFSPSTNVSRFELQASLNDTDEKNDEGEILYQGDDPEACEAAFWTWWDKHADEYPVEHAPARGPRE